MRRETSVLVVYPPFKHGFFRAVIDAIARHGYGKRERERERERERNESSSEVQAISVLNYLLQMYFTLYVYRRTGTTGNDRKEVIYLRSYSSSMFSSLQRFITFMYSAPHMRVFPRSTNPTVQNQNLYRKNISKILH